MLQKVQIKFPQLSCWMETCYGSPILLKFWENTITSEARVKQGNPLATLLFSHLPQPVAKQLQRVEGLVLNAWYLNGTLVGSRDTLCAA